MPRRAFRLVPVAASAWTAAAIGVGAPGAASPAAIGLWVVAMVGVAVSAFVRRSGFRRTVAVVVLALGAAAAVMSHVAAAQPGRETVEAVGGGGRTVEVTAVVAGKIEPGATGGAWFDAIATRLVSGDASVTGAFPVRIGAEPDDVPMLVEADLGAELSVTGIRLPARPGDRAFASIRAREVSVSAHATGLLRASSDLRHSLREAAGSLPGRGADLIPGLSVGDTVTVGPDLDAAMKESSLAHLTAVSGANCAIVVGIAFAVAAACGVGRAWRIAAGVLALGGFVLLVTPEPSVVRAAAMALIAMLSLALGRPGGGVAVLSLAVTVLLAFDPWLALSLGFALSAAATASLLVLAVPLGNGLARWMPRPLALGLAVPLAAQLACAPLLVVVDPRVPLLGVLANVLAAPAAPAATVVGLLACVAAPVPWLQGLLTAVAWLPASWIAGVADVVAGMPAQLLPWAGDIVGVAALAAVSLAVVLVVATTPEGRAPPRLLRIAAVTALGVAVGVGAGQASLRSVLGPLTLPSAWSIAVCEIGQGDAVVLRDAGRLALVDTGPDPEPLSACLERLGVHRLDLVVLTHFDIDHVGGVDAIIGRAAAVLHGPVGDARDERTLTRLAEGGATLLSAAPGMQGVLGEARWRVLWPAARVPPGNDASVVLDVRGGMLPSTILLGDLSAEAQRALQRTASLGRYDVVKVAHHGSGDQDEGLYRRTRPDIALIPVGAGNGYGHPRDSILSILAATGAVVGRTDEDGLVAVWREDGLLRLWRERGVGTAG